MAYSSIRIQHYVDYRDKITKEARDYEWNVIPIQSFEVNKGIFEANQRKWEESEKCKQTVSIFQSLNLSVNIQQIVAFAFGSIRRDADYPGSSYQHALAVTICKVLSEKNGENGIACYAQDPAYSEIDKLILNENGFTVLDDPHGLLQVDESTLVLSFGPDVPVKQVVLDLVKPAAMIWERVGREEDFPTRW
jgi:hypothetical protein